MKPFVHDITGIDPINAFAAVKHLPYSLLLDSADRNHPNSRYTFIACLPIETLEAKDGKISVTNWEQRLSFTGEPFEILSSRMKSWVSFATRHPNLPPFQGGAAGLFGYDLGRYLEDLPSHAKSNSKIPDMAIGIYDQVIAHDHLLKKTYIFTHARSETEAIQKRTHLLNIISQKMDIPDYEPIEPEWKLNFSKDEYLQRVQKVINYIHDGDIFQANIAQCFNAPLPDNFDPFVHYLNLRDINPAPFATYMNLGDIKISSASPERFMTVKDKQVETCPIKGTRPRSDKPAQDRANKADLEHSEKDNAENTMIVDLLRNDLSRVCDPHSIKVSSLCKIESFASVHHLVSTIQGKLAHDKTSIDLLSSSFPGGSITGAPKIRAMEIIEEIEPTRRGAYCGSIGYIGFDDSMDTNILIRTLTYEDGKVSLQVGGGIVSESNPEAEYQETLDKADAILASFEYTRGTGNNRKSGT
ncbi:MAG: aminodeoxychorismate synthase component I [Alphaproteobacteria bacterium]